MIIEINKKRLDEVCKYVFELNKLKEHQCRPFKNDIILGEITEKFTNLILHEDDKLLISTDNESKINGVLGLFTELEDEYLQAFCGIYARENYQEVGREFLTYLEEEYKGMNMMFAFPKENIQGIELMINNNFNNIEDAIIYELTTVIKDRVGDVHIVDNESISKEQIINFYDEHQEDVYWTIDKVLADDNHWAMKHYIEDSKIVGSIYARIYNSYSAEIFGVLSIDNSNRDIIERDLIKQVSIECQKRGISNVTLFSDLTRYNMFAEEIGFVEVDTHLTYQRRL